MKCLIIGTDSTHTECFISSIGNFKGTLAVYSEDDQKCGYLADKYGVATFPLDLDKAIAWSDAVMILSRFGEDHLDPAIKVIEAGRNLFIDKPLTVNCEEALRIKQAAMDFGVKCMSGSPLNFARTVVDLSKRTEGQAVKKIVLTCPAQCNDLGDDLRLRNVFFYGIHALEVGLRFIKNTQVKAFEFEKNDDILLRVKTNHCELEVRMLNGIKERYEVSVELADNIFNENIVLDGSYYDFQVPFILRGFRNKNRFLNIETSIEAIRILEAVNNA